ncbi:hypothetical protein DXG03_009331 [Asterophora parasitica]|uniref:Uncharacterized protein n=1 Tax=Asterophora parasitica TaxID=117018 RepID=A0A9P7G854_9AGAR|nr:hypothetical protein DXG03_009331 [Asterophora parasitica]
MGVKLPRNTKVPDNNLSKRLHQTLDAAQRHNEVLVPISPINPSAHPKWSSSKPLKDAVSRGNMAESFENMINGWHKRAPPTSTAEEHTFREVRKIFLAFAHHLELGCKIIDIFSLGEKQPLFPVLYTVVNRPPHMSLYDYLGQLLGLQSVGTVSTTVLERKYMLKLLGINSKRLSLVYQPRRERYEAEHILSFLVPVGPLGLQDLGKLNNNPGSSYCGKGYRFILNRFDSASDAKNMIEPAAFDGPPLSVHGEKAFLVKFQISLTQFGPDSSMLVYDRQKSFQIHWVRKEDPEAWAEGNKAMTGKVKIYRWARRVGDYQCSVCFDRAPPTDPVW